MRIGPVVGPGVLRNYQATKPPSANLRPATGRDEVTFTEEALSFSKVLAEAKNVPGVRTPEELARIEEIKKAVRQGKYWVETDKIVEKILENLNPKS